MKKLLITIAAFIGLVGIGVVAANSLQANALYTKPNCNASAVITCGTFNESQLKAGLKKSASARALYSHLGISTTFSGSKTGTLKANGDIVVGGKVVAKNAQSYGNGAIKGATTVKVGGHTYHKWSAKQAFLGQDTPVHVFFDKYGRFVNAIADVCGNPIVATPTKPKPSFVCNYLKAEPIKGSRTNFKFTANAVAKNGAKKTKYVFTFGDGKSTTVNTNKETVSVNHNYAKAGSYTAVVKVYSNFTTVSCKVSVSVKPAPSAKCDNLTAKAVSRTKYDFTTSASASNGAKITGYTYNFGDGTVVKSSSKTISHNYAKAGTYTARVTVHSTAGDKNCQVTITVKPAPAATCTGLTASITNRTNVTLNATASAINGASIKSYNFVVTDKNGKTVYTNRVTTSATAARTSTKLEEGTYNAKVTVNTSEGAKTSANCATEFTVARKKVPAISITKLVEGVKHKTVKANTDFDYQIKVTNTGEVDLKDAVVTDTPEKGITLIKGNVGTVENNVWTYTIPSLKVGESKSFTLTAQVPNEDTGILTNTVCVDTPTIPGQPDDCDEADVDVPAPEEMTVCRLSDKEYPVTIKKRDFDKSKYSTNPSDCEEQPEVPVTELPQTGAEDVVLGGVGIAGLIAGLGYYVTSRRSL